MVDAELTVNRASRLAELRKRDQLPHLHSYPWYPWAKEFYDSQNKTNLLCAANQISKSSTQIRKCINWATNKDLWQQLWPGKTPNQFWYMYPSGPVLEAEFETKWSEFLPRGEMKDDPVYGWKEKRREGKLNAIHFNSGVIVYFKVYAQKASDLQSGTLYALFCDEEMPLHLYDELSFRLSATNGYFHMVFTATLGQEFWRRALEPGPRDKEELVGAWKRSVSLYDSMYYIDGSPSQWTEERILQVKLKCSDENEVQKRVYGRFILAGSRKYDKFDAIRHMKKPHALPTDWLVYGAVDPGSGGEKGHAAAICFVAVRPDFKEGRVFAGWRGDGVITDNSAIVKKWKEIKSSKNLTPVMQLYDWASKDFFIVAQGMDENFQPAEKSHDIGEDVINTLFENDMMAIYETEELGKLAGELSSLRKDQNKRHAKDNFADAFRYSVTKIPWDFSDIIREKVKGAQVETVEHPLSPMQKQIKERREAFNEDQSDEENGGWPSVDQEMEEWNDLAGG